MFAPSGCWEWTGAKTPLGYGKIRVKRSEGYTHRLMWRTYMGEIPDGMVIDHLCRNASCCRPSHLRVVTHKENLMADGSMAQAKKNAEKKSCKRGHPFDGDNLYAIRCGGVVKGRGCRQCSRENQRDFWRKRNALKQNVDL